MNFMKSNHKLLGAALSIGIGFCGSVTAADTGSDISKSARELKNKVRTASYDLFEKRTVVLDFNAGSKDLSNDARDKLKSQMSAVAGEAAVERVYVASWADREMPKADAKTDRAEEKRDRASGLAGERVDAIENELERLASDVSVTTYNMAEKPNWFEKTFKLDDAKVKSVMNNRDEAEKTFTDHEDQKLAALGRIFAEKGGPGKAVVVLETKESQLSE